MHEVAASALVAEVRVGVSRDALCLRLDGPRLAGMLADGSAALALVIAGTDVRVVPIERTVGRGRDHHRNGGAVRSAWLRRRLPTSSSGSRFVTVPATCSRPFRTAAAGRSRVPMSASASSDWQA